MEQRGSTADSPNASVTRLASWARVAARLEACASVPTQRDPVAA